MESAAIIKAYPIVGTILFERVAANLRGRGSCHAIGAVAGRALTKNLATLVMIVGLAAAQLITTLSMAFIPAMKEIDRKA